MEDKKMRHSEDYINIYNCCWKYRVRANRNQWYKPKQPR